MTTLVPILGDQLTPTISSLAAADMADTVVLMMEVADETTYVRHHKQKIAFILSAMRHHAAALREAGWQVDYVRLNDADNSGSFTGEVARAVARHAPDRIVATEAGEWRVRAMLDAWETLFGVPVDILTDDRFIGTHADFEAWAASRKVLTMEYFYRAMRQRTGVLMDGNEPAGGQWNFDKENRKPASHDLFMPQPLAFAPDETTQDVLALVAARFADHPGTLDGFDYAVTAEDAARQADTFFAHALEKFGDYEDAMLTGERFLWHSILSPYINSGLLDPLDLCRRAEAEYRAGRAPPAGFILSRWPAAVVDDQKETATKLIEVRPVARLALDALPIGFQRARGRVGERRADGGDIHAQAEAVEPVRLGRGKGDLATVQEPAGQIGAVGKTKPVPAGRIDKAAEVQKDRVSCLRHVVHRKKRSPMARQGPQPGVHLADDFRNLLQPPADLTHVL